VVSSTAISAPAALRNSFTDAGGPKSGSAERPSRDIAVP